MLEISDEPCYIVSWYGRGKISFDAYHTRQNAGNGWYKYTKFVPIKSVNSISEIEFPYDPTMTIMQISNIP